MNWYYHTSGIHVHVRVYMHGAFCGNLCFTPDEFEEVRSNCRWIIYYNETEEKKV